jgi:hypothetical protein
MTTMPRQAPDPASTPAVARWLARSSIRNAVLAALVFAVAFAVLADAAARVDHWADENDYLITSRYFRMLFVEGDLASGEWDDNYWTHTQPMLTRYLIGGWLWLRGYDLDDMPRRYDLTNSFAENQRKGRVPDATLLRDARLSLLPFAAGSIALLYLLGATLGGTVAGLAAAGAALASPLAREHMVRTMPEAPLAFFILLALAVGIVGVQRGCRGGLGAWWAIGLGLAAGLALATKLTGVLGLVAVALCGVLAVAGVARPIRERATRHLDGTGPSDGRERSGNGVTASMVRVGRGWVLAIVVALAAFIATNPHLYSNPLVHTAHLFKERLDDERGRQREVPGLAIQNPLARPGPVLHGSLVSGVLAGSWGVPVEAALAAIGLGVLLARAWRVSGQTGHLTPDGLTLLTVVVYFVGISAGLHLLYARYFVPTVLLGALLCGLGAQALKDTALRRLPLASPTPEGYGIGGQDRGPRVEAAGSGSRPAEST